MARRTQIRKGENMRPFQEVTHFAGFDWAQTHHDVVVVDRQAQVVAVLRFDDTAEGWQSFREKCNPSQCWL